MTFQSDVHPCYRTEPESSAKKVSVPPTETEPLNSSLLAILQDRRNGDQSRSSGSKGIGGSPTAATQRKPLLGAPEEVTDLDHRIGSNGGATSALDLLPHRLRIRKRVGPISPAQEVYELTRQNGYLLAEVALLKETRCALRELQAKTQEAFTVLRDALQEVSRKLVDSEQRLMNYWGIHTGDGSEELNVF